MPLTSGKDQILWTERFFNDAYLYIRSFLITYSSLIFIMQRQLSIHHLSL